MATENDYLTGLLLRKSFERSFSELLQKSASAKTVFSVAIMDVDHFKKFNDKFGHLFGDEVLKYVAGALTSKLEDNCRVFRYGGDEFIVLFAGKTSRDAGLLMKLCVRGMNNHPFLFKDKFFKVGISCGIAGYPDDGKTMAGLLKKADDALYFSKRTGRNRIMLAERLKRIKIRNAIIMALSLVTILWSGFLLYSYFFKNDVKRFVGRIRNIRVVTSPKHMDTVILKTGAIFKGYIVEDIEDKIIFDLDMEQGRGRTIFDKDEIARIRYGREPKKAGHR